MYEYIVINIILYSLYSTLCDHSSARAVQLYRYSVRVYRYRTRSSSSTARRYGTSTKSLVVKVTSYRAYMYARGLSWVCPGLNHELVQDRSRGY
jgi:hypothetical protein